MGYTYTDIVFHFLSEIQITGQPVFYLANLHRFLQRLKYLLPTCTFLQINLVDLFMSSFAFYSSACDFLPAGWAEISLPKIGILWAQ